MFAISLYTENGDTDGVRAALLRRVTTVSGCKLLYKSVAILCLLTQLFHFIRMSYCCGMLFHKYNSKKNVVFSTIAT